MKLLPIQILRLSLAISVSLWMAGAGCLLGCSNETHASLSVSNESTDTVVAEDSCASGSHDCCKKKAHHASAPENNPQPDPTESLFEADQSRMFESCPMAVNASAIVSKSRAKISQASVAKTIEAPLPSMVVTTASRSVDRPSVPNRGPTYLRCCVFLI